MCSLLLNFNQTIGEEDCQNCATFIKFYFLTHKNKYLKNFRKLCLKVQNVGYFTQSEASEKFYRYAKICEIFRPFLQIKNKTDEEEMSATFESVSNSPILRICSLGTLFIANWTFYNTERYFPSNFCSHLILSIDYSLLPLHYFIKGVPSIGRKQIICSFFGSIITKINNLDGAAPYIKVINEAKKLKIQNPKLKIILTVGLSQCRSHLLSEKKTMTTLTLDENGQCGRRIYADWTEIFYPNATIVNGIYRNYDKAYALKNLKIFTGNFLTFVQQLNLDGINIFPGKLMLNASMILSEQRVAFPSLVFSITTYFKAIRTKKTTSDLLELACGIFDWIIINNALIGEDFKVEGGLFFAHMKFESAKILKRCPTEPKTLIIDTVNLYALVANYQPPGAMDFYTKYPSRPITNSEIIAYFEVLTFSAYIFIFVSLNNNTKKNNFSIVIQTMKPRHVML